MRGEPVGDGVGGDAGLVGLQEENLTALGRPEKIGADGEFFGVEPVDFAVEDLAFVGLGAILFLVLVFLFVQKGALAGEAFDGMYVQVVFADVGETFSVGGELGILAGVGRGGELDGGTGVEAVIPELAVSVEEEMAGIGGPGVGGDVIAGDAFFLALVADFGGGRGELGELDVAD